jgi:hypothetical protein
LPFTGEDVALVAAVGLLLLWSGLLQRRFSARGRAA